MTLLYTIIVLVSLIFFISVSRNLATSVVLVYILMWFIPDSFRMIGNITVLSFLGCLSICSLFFQTIFKRNIVGDKNIYRGFRMLSCRMLFLIFLISVFSVDPFQHSWIKSYFLYVCIIVAFIRGKHEQREYLLIEYTIWCLVLVSGIYGIYTLITQYNPWGMMLAVYDAVEGQGLDNDHLGEERGVIAGRIYGFEVHPLMFAGVLLCSFFLTFHKYQQDRKKITKLLDILMLLFICGFIFLTGSRSVMIALILFFLFYYIAVKNVWFLLLMICIIGPILYVLIDIYVHDEFIRSVIFFWKQKEAVNGSNPEMRLYQLQACIEEVSDDVSSFIFGMGPGWCGRYLDKYGNCYPFQAFESIFFSSIIQYGVVCGLIYIWLTFIPLIQFSSRYIVDRQRKRLFVSSVLSMFVFTSVTGEWYGLGLFVVVFMIMLLKSRFEYGLNIDSERKI